MRLIAMDRDAAGSLSSQCQKRTVAAQSHLHNIMSAAPLQNHVIGSTIYLLVASTTADCWKFPRKTARHVFKK
jgi:hypothetical protein